MEENNEKVKSNNEKASSKNIVICLVIVLLVAIIIVLSIIVSNLSNPINKFKNSLETASGAEIEKIYNNIENIEDRKEVEKLVEEKASMVVTNYANGTVSYEEAISNIEKYKDLDNLSKYYKSNLKNIENIKISKDNFKLAEEKEVLGELTDSINLYTNVIKDDTENYDIAQMKIEEVKITLKNNILTTVDEFVTKNDYISAKEELDSVGLIFDSDNEITTRKTEIDEKARIQLIEEAKNNQELEVVSAKIAIQHTKYKSLYPDLLQVIVQNNTQKTVRNYEVSILGYDSNGFPLKIEGEYDFSGGKYEFKGNAEDVNIMPGKRYGNGYGWGLDSKHNISTIKALVTKVTYYDGTEWENPYYEYWIEEYKEKPLINNY